MVENGRNVNARDPCMRTPLIMISIYLTGFDNWYNREKFAKLFLEHNANPNLCDCFGLTPLAHAAINGQSDYVKVLLSYERTDWQLCDKAGNNAVMLAARYGQSQVLRVFCDHFLCDHNISHQLIDSKNCDNKSALDLAYEAGHYDCVELLSELKARLNSEQSISSEEATNIVYTNVSNNKQSISESFNANNNHVLQLSETDSLIKSQTKSHENLSLISGRPVMNGIKLPPINGKRFVEYSEWNNKSINETNDRKTI